MDGGLIKSTDLITRNPLNILNSWVGGGGFGWRVEKVDNGCLAQLQDSGQFNHKFEHQTIPQALYQIKS
jgi:hypothetical protein